MLGRRAKFETLQRDYSDLAVSVMPRTKPLSPLGRR